MSIMTIKVIVYGSNKQIIYKNKYIVINILGY